MTFRLLNSILLYQSIKILDVMDRLTHINGHLSHSQNSNVADMVVKVIESKRNKIIRIFEPHITLYDYRKILPKIERARKAANIKTKEMISLAGGKLLPDELQMKIHQQFRACLSDNLHELVSGMLNELTDRLKKKIQNIDERNLIAKSIKIYSSVMGSYQLKLSLIQKISPNIRTLSYLQNEMMQNTGDRQMSNSIWVLFYIFSFAFVQMFGKYITHSEKAQVILILQSAFVSKLALITASLYEEINETGQTYFQIDSKIQAWLDEIAKNIG